MWGGVRPSHRRRGIGTQLFEWAIARAKDIAPVARRRLPAKLETDAAGHQTELRALAERMGFEPVRHFLEIARPTREPLADVAAPAGLELVPWSAELDEGARLAHLEAFEDHWGSEPRTVEEWTQWYTGHRGVPSRPVGARGRPGQRRGGVAWCCARPTRRTG